MTSMETEEISALLSDLHAENQKAEAAGHQDVCVGAAVVMTFVSKNNELVTKVFARGDVETINESFLEIAGVAEQFKAAKPQTLN